MEKIKQRMGNVRSVSMSLSNVFRSATAEERAEGMEWYSAAHTFAHGLHRRYGYSLEVCSAVISCLSVSVRWDVNMRDADTLLKAHREGQDEGSITCATYGHQVSKAWAIASTGDISIIGKGEKTISFYLNILRGDSPDDAVTVDRQMMGAATGSLKYEHLNVTLTDKRYRIIREATQRIAKRENMAPKDVQAIIWVAYRNMLQNLN